MVGFLPQSTEAFTSGCPFSIDAPSSVEALFRRESMPPTSSATFGCRIRFVCLSTCNKQARLSAEELAPLVPLRSLSDQFANSANPLCAKCLDSVLRRS